MSDDALDADLDRIVDFPWEVLEYLTWLRQQPSSREATASYLFDEPSVRFAPEDADLVVAERDVRVQAQPAGLLLSTPRAPAGVPVPGLAERERPALLALLARLDGQQPLGVLRASLALEQRTLLAALLGAAYGKLIFSPLAIVEAERGISGVEITRFPGSPYEVARPYWKNMAAVRARTTELWAALGDDQSFVRELRRLHVVALMGDDLHSYYQPASPISSGRAAPGRFMHTRTQLLAAPDGDVISSGPRVSAALVGGARYHELLYQTLSEPEAAAPRLFRDDAGLDWGQRVDARAGDEATAPWFCPPRPIRPQHLAALRAALSAAERAAQAGQREACISALAAFHRDFCRLHPFHCGNQSLAMNLVNTLARHALGAGLPHLMLDHLAFRLSAPAYERVFRRAAGAYVDPQPNPALRYLRLASNRTRTFELMRQIQAAPSLEAARAACQTDPVAERLALLRDD